jgi:hypothetical protein
MSVSDANPQLKFMPFHAIVEDGLDRVFNILGSAEFTFYVKGSKVKSTIGEAVLLSPKHSVICYSR